ncbi:Swi5-domain-containing protein [Phaeosphaeriaceae sp. PMI808]|nr:Swi5-domain-containing protein [Phaeosphaeriaceae sp. PMI808]
MAAREGRREVPDSEDEPMTSSPVDALDGAADKLFATAPDPLQDVQDALQPATQHHQALLERTANPVGGQSGGLDADQENASINCDASRVEHDEIQPNVATSLQSQFVSTIDEEAHLTLKAVIQPELEPIDMKSQHDVNEMKAQTSNPSTIDSPAHATKLTSLHEQTNTGDEKASTTPEMSEFLKVSFPSPSRTKTNTNTGNAKPESEAPETTVIICAPHLASENEAPPTNRDEASLLSSVTQDSAITASESTPENDTTQNNNDSTTNPTKDRNAVISSEGTRLIVDSLVPAAESSSHREPTPPTQTSVMSSDSSPLRTPQEVALAELKAQKAALLASLATLPAIQIIMEETASGAEIQGDDNEPTEADVMAAANTIVKNHIKLLHEYNELKDVGQGLMGLIADQRGVRIVEVQEEFGVDAKD